LNANQKRLFEEARRRNPNLKMPAEDQPGRELTDDDLALIKQGVGDKTNRPASSAGVAGGESPSSDFGFEHTGSIVTYFEDRGFGFLRPEGGGQDIFFHISRVSEGPGADLRPGVKVVYELGTDRAGKVAASSVRVAPPPEPA
jgi:CspA family cold shock protein